MRLKKIGFWNWNYWQAKINKNIKMWTLKNRGSSLQPLITALTHLSMFLRQIMYLKLVYVKLLCLHFILITLSHLSHLSGVKDRWNVAMKIIWYQDHIWKWLGFYLEKIRILPLKSVHKKSDLVYWSLQRVTGALGFLEVTLHCVLSCRVLAY